jgi:pimeloyl-ACP methyl ester carboxylesterase
LAKRYCQELVKEADEKDEKQTQQPMQEQQQMHHKHPKIAASSMEARAVEGILFDLRGHGKSQLGDVSGENIDNNTIEGCAEDVRRTLLQRCYSGRRGVDYHDDEVEDEEANTTLTTQAKVTELQVVGHSLGGRVGLQFCYDCCTTGPSSHLLAPQPPAVAPSRLWLLDTVPGAANAGVVRVVKQLERFLDDFSNKQQEELDEESSASTAYHRHHHHVDHRVGLHHQYRAHSGARHGPPSRGGDRSRHDHHHEHIARLLHQKYSIDAPTARWLASSFRGGKFSFDLNVARELLRSLPLQDFWGQLEAVLSSNRTRVDLVMAGRNPLWTSDIVSRLEELKGRYPGSMGLHRLPRAGHWVHTDDLEGLLGVMMMRESRRDSLIH